MTKLSIKKKLLLYSLAVQVLIFCIFSVTLYETLGYVSKDNLHQSLKLITLDIKKEIYEHVNELDDLELNDEFEYQLRPLYIRLLEIKSEKFDIVKSYNFPKDIKSTYKKIVKIKNEEIIFNNQDSYVILRTNLRIDKRTYLLEVATTDAILLNMLHELLELLLRIVPIILILSTIGAYFLIYKSFLPIENILKKLKLITVKDLSKRLPRTNNNDEIDDLSKEINSLLERLEISFEKVSQFSSDASHELKTPLTIIRGEIEIALRKPRDSNEYKETLNTCHDEVLIIQDTIDSLLFLSKPEDQFHDIKKEVINIDAICENSINELKAYASEKNISITYEQNTSSSIEAYSGLMKIAIKNILKNAISFSHKDAIVVLRNSSNNKELTIIIEDKGIGIPKGEQEKIFENFYRTDKSRNKNSGGTGLGMAICNKIISMHSGSITLKSEEDQGTIVTITIPLSV